MIGRGWRIAGLVGVLGATFLVGCGSAAGPAPEKSEAAAQALIQSNPTPPPPFPWAQYTTVNIPNYSCQGKTVTQVIAYPTTSQSLGDPYHTPYTASGLPGSNCPDQTYCNHMSDLWGIPHAHGFRYKVQDLRKNVFFLQGIADYNKSWSYCPWNYPYDSTTGKCTGSGFPAAWSTPIDSNSHPSYGSDYKGGDWLLLWNLAYTYSPTNAPTVQAKNLECVAVYAGRYDNYGNLVDTNVQIDFFSSADDYDPNGVPW